MEKRHTKLWLPTVFSVLFVVDTSPFWPIICFIVLAQDRAALQLDEGASQFATSNRINLENFSSGSRPRLPDNERLPGAVLLARARLLERLRGVPVPVSGSRLVCCNLEMWGTKISNFWPMLNYEISLEYFNSLHHIRKLCYPSIKTIYRSMDNLNSSPTFSGFSNTPPPPPLASSVSPWC